MAPKEKKTQRRVLAHKPKIAHKLAKYVRTLPVHLTHLQGGSLPSAQHFTLGGPQKPKLRNTQNSWYPADDEKPHFQRKRLVPKAPKLRSSLTPGRVLILLAGKFRGKRVVLLKTLPSNLLLVTGPHKINGVPLRRVNAAYVLATQTTVPLAGVDVSKVDDTFFAKVAPKGKAADSFKAGKRQFTEEQKTQNAQRLKANREVQRGVDKPLLDSIKKVDFLGRYLSSRFTLYNRTKPHDLVF